MPIKSHEFWIGVVSRMPFKGGCDAHLCLSEGFTLWDFCWKSAVHELCTTRRFQPIGVSF